jgi:hypothetical protein
MGESIGQLNITAFMRGTMTKLTKHAYNRLMLQAEEAKELGMTNLAGAVFDAIGSVPCDEAVTYNENDLRVDAYKSLWKIAADVVAYHNASGADIIAIDGVVSNMANRIVTAIENELGVEGQIGVLEEKLPGQK